jgi:hypothetical protein
MPVIQPENVADLVADTLRDLGKPKFTDISSSIQNHVAFKNLLHENRAVLHSGYGIQFNVLVNQSNAARNVSINESDNVNMVDGMVQATANWRGSQTSYMVIRQLLAMNREPSRIVDYVKQQRLMALISLAELMESNWWGAPSSTDTKTPYGYAYWITKNATAGFNGGALFGSTVAGLSPTTYPQWSNYTAPYTNVTRDDFIRAARKAATFTDFRPPVDGIPTPNTGDDYGFYTNYSVLQPLEEALESQNDNLGLDIAKMDGKVRFRNVNVVWVPWLERDTTNPFIGIDWGWLKTYILEDEWMRETSVPITPGQHNAHSHFLDLTYNWVSKNRRCHLCISNGTTTF